MKPTALITGASSGFGLEFAKLFAKDGYDLVLTAKPPGNLRKIAEGLKTEHGVQVRYVELDLAGVDASKKLYEWVKNQKVSISVLVNNAGLGLYGKYAAHPFDKEKELITVNVNALSELCHLYITEMIKLGGGRILNVASIAGFQAGPFYATYFASKAYVLLLSEALFYEYAPDNIHVTALLPGVARTNFFKVAGMREDSKILQSNLMSPEKVALAGYRGLMNNKRTVIPGVRNKIVSLGYRILPRSTIIKITRSFIRSAAE